MIGFQKKKSPFQESGNFSELYSLAYWSNRLAKLESGTSRGFWKPRNFGSQQPYLGMYTIAKSFKNYLQIFQCVSKSEALQSISFLLQKNLGVSPNIVVMLAGCPTMAVKVASKPPINRRGQGNTMQELRSSQITFFISLLPIIR